MKTIITMMMLLSSLSVIAQEVPEYLKGGQVTVTDKNGKVYKFSSDEYAAVPRKPKVKKQVVTTPVIQEKIVERVVIEKQYHKAYIIQQPKNIVSLGVLRSQHGIKSSSYSNQVDVETDRDTGVSVQYQRNIYKNIYLGGRADTNEGYELNVGLGF